MFAVRRRFRSSVFATVVIGVLLGIWGALLAAGTASADERYGAWPEIANWIEAPWDLTSEVLAAELRSRLLALPAAADPAGAP